MSGRSAVATSILMLAGSLAWSAEHRQAPQGYRVTITHAGALPSSPIPQLGASAVPSVQAGAAANAAQAGPASVGEKAAQLVAPIAEAAAAGTGSAESMSRMGQDLADLRGTGGSDAVAVPAAGFDDAVRQGAAIVKEFRAEVGRVIVGQQEAVDLTLVSLLVNRGHLLLEGMPGLGKTKLVETVSRVSGLTSQRIQFAPDMLPSDIRGFKDKDPQGNWYTKKGPILKAHIIQADEINRGTPRAKAALLQPMQEGKVTIDDETHALPQPFLVLATMNPIDTEGVFPMLEPEKDRFLVSAFIDYPTEEEESRIAREQSKQDQVEPKQVLSVEKIQQLRKVIEQIRVEPHMEAYIQRIVRATRPAGPDAGIPAVDLKDNVTLGAGPRASISMMQVARVYAFLDGRSYVSADDVQKAALPVLRHRIKLSSKGRVGKITAEKIIAEILKSVAPPLPR